MRLHIRLNRKKEEKTLVNTFLSDKKIEIGSLLSVKCNFVRFSDYKVKTLPELQRPLKGGKPLIKKNVEIIAGVPPVVLNKNPPLIDGYPLDVIHEVIFQKDIFFEVMALIKNIDAIARFNEQTEQAISTEGILALCRKYGIYTRVDGPIWMQHRIHGFALRDFKYRLFTLRWRFAVYMAVYYEDYSLMRELVPLIDMPTKKTSDEQIIEAAKDWLCTGIGESIKMSLCSNDNGFGLEVYATDIISACDTFLSFMIVGGDGKNIKLCPNCLEFFYGHGNKKYCDNCNRKTVWSREKRAAEKQENRAGK